MNHFAYGSNMCQGRLLDRVPDATFGEAAKLPGHSLRFHKASFDGSGKADAFFTGVETDEVWGVIVDVPDHRKPQLDQAEGLGHGYLEREVEVIDQSGKGHSACAYLAEDEHIDPTRLPYDWYLRLVVTGAIARGLPDKYVKKVVSVASVADPQPSRPARPPDEVVC